MQAGRRDRQLVVLATALVACVVVGCVASALFVRGGHLPRFYQSIWLGPQQVVIVQSGPSCRRDLSMHACQSGLVERVFRVTYWTPQATRVIVSIAEQ